MVASRSVAGARREVTVPGATSSGGLAPAPSPTAGSEATAATRATTDAAADLDACIGAVLRDPFPDGSVALDRFYREAVARYASGDPDEEKYFSEVASRFGGVGELQPIGHFGLAEIERIRTDAFSRRSALQRYDFVMRARTAHPLREITVARIAETLLRLDDRAGAASALDVLDARRSLGRCDREVRAKVALLLREIASGPLAGAACVRASATADELGDAETIAAIAARCATASAR